jgi:hypothetical protein
VRAEHELESKTELGWKLWASKQTWKLEKKQVQENILVGYNPLSKQAPQPLDRTKARFDRHHINHQQLYEETQKSLAGKAIAQL